MRHRPIDVETGAGRVRGEIGDDGVARFLGIPYAAPPTGRRRFQPPAPPASWTGVRNATAPGPTAPQSDPEGAVAELIPSQVIAGDDYLNLNVWTPAVPGSAPVMVFVHGGAFVSGSGSLPVYDGHSFALDGVVLVSINYRLGADGFLWFGEGTPNLGLLDQVAALRWVRDNITGFGGDPNAVTVFGESAGAMSIGALLAMPAARGLFRGAILESGAGESVISPRSARLIGERLAALLEVEATRAAIAQVPVPALLAAQRQVAEEVLASTDQARWGEAARNWMPFEPVVDGEVLPAVPVAACAAQAPEVDLLIGTNRDEANLFFVPTGLTGQMTEPLLAMLVGARTGGLSVLQTYRSTRPDASAGELWNAIVTDDYYRLPALRLAQAIAGAHVYEFTWGSPAYGGALGACHALELPFVFDTLGASGVELLVGDRPPRSLAREMHEAWVRFAATRDPGWAPYREGRVVYCFGEASQELRDPRAEERRAWDGPA